MIYLVVFSALAGALVTLVLVVWKYKSLQDWRIDRQPFRNPEQQKKTLTAEEVLELLAKIRPFPIGTLHGWRVFSYKHGNRIWWHSLPLVGSRANLTVFAAFGGFNVNGMTVFQVLKDISHTCSWKSGVVSTSYIIGGENQQKSGWNSKSAISFSSQHDVITEEHVNVPSGKKHAEFSFKTISTETDTVTLQRYWNIDSSSCWLLERNEKTKGWTLYLIQPLKDGYQTIVTVMVHEDHNKYQQTASSTTRLLGSLQNYLLYKKIQIPSFPYTLFSINCGGQNFSAQGAISADKSEVRFLSRVKTLLERKTSQALKISVSKEELQKSEDILRHGSFSSPPAANSNSMVKHKETNQDLTAEKVGQLTANADGDKEKYDEMNQDLEAEKVGQLSTKANGEGHADSCPVSESDKGILFSSFKRSISFKEDLTSLPEHLTEGQKIVFYKTKGNEAAAGLLAEAVLASNINLKESIFGNSNESGGWAFCGLEEDIVILRKIPKEGSTLQSYMGKGLIQLPPRVVWDTVRNPRTRFTYDESLKKVDVLEIVNNSVKIVYLYHEMVSLFHKESCDVCVLQSERVESGRLVLAMQSTRRKDAPWQENSARPKMFPSGWIIEPMQKENRLYSMVTYIMQMDFGQPKQNSDKLPFEELVAHQPLSIADLRRYLRSASLWAQRRHSTPVKS